MTDFPFLGTDTRDQLRRLADAARTTYEYPTPGTNARQRTYAAAVEDVLRYIAGDAGMTDDLAAVLTRPADDPDAGTCRYCGRTVTRIDGQWIDSAATGDDSTWRETCDAHDTFTAEHDVENAG